jgi:fido (protein-threonine AMPylation protein)
MPTGNMDPYVYPGTNVLRDIRDPDRLSRFEMDMTTRRIGELTHAPTPGQFDAKHLQAIHRHIFQDVYPWAGEFRTVNISRSGQFPFAFSEHIIPSLDRLSVDLEKERYLGNNAETTRAWRRRFRRLLIMKTTRQRSNGMPPLAASAMSGRMIGEDDRKR